MKRSSLIGCLASLSLFGCPSASGPCDPEVLGEKAQLCPDRLSLGFAQEFNSGTFIGTSVPNSLAVRNGGLEDLTIEEVTLSATDCPTTVVKPGEAMRSCPRFSLAAGALLPDGGTDSSLPIVIPTYGNYFVTVFFAPTEAKVYSGVLTVKSNSSNTPPDGGCAGEWCFAVSGCGVRPDGGGTEHCLRGGG